MIPSSELPLIVSHRGAKREAPENTFPAFESALSYPIDGIELDVQLTTDRIPVIYHDRTLWKISQERKRIFNCSHEYLKSLDFGIWHSSKFKGERIPTLKETIDRFFRKTRLFVEIKSRAWDRAKGSSVMLAQKVVEILKKAQADSQGKEFFVLTFDRTALVLLLQLEPSWSYILNLASSSHLEDYDLERFASIYGFCTNVNRLTKSFSDRVHGNNQKVLTYTCNTPRQVKWAQHLEVDVLMTDNPKWLFKYLNRTGH
jgi:glycerophosphoryl diester phosphodiesterase